jgi:hypothetical protein
MGYNWYVPDLRYDFCLTLLTTGEELDLDGFVFQIKGVQYGANLDQLCRTVKRVLKYLCDHDPSRK